MVDHSVYLYLFFILYNLYNCVLNRIVLENAYRNLEVYNWVLLVHMRCSTAYNRWKEVWFLFEVLFNLFILAKNETGEMQSGSI